MTGPPRAAAGLPGRASLRADTDQRAAFVELFFDLVFVFAVTQIVAQIHTDPSVGGVGEGLLVFWLVWWAWTQFTWALNPANTEHGLVQLVTIAATAVAFLMAYGLPAAFEGGQGLWFTAPYVAVRTIGLGLYLLVAWDSPAHRRAVSRFAILSIPGLALAIIGAGVDQPARFWLWGAVVIADLAASGIAGRAESWQLNPSHFAERHGLFVIIALGESLIAVGVSASALQRDAASLIAVTVGVVLAGLLWWTYFSQIQSALEHSLMATPPEKQGATARDAYSLLHFPLIGGIIGIAVGLEAAIAHPQEPLHTPELRLLVIGTALVITSAALAYRRASRLVLWPRLGIAAAVTLALLLASGVNAIWTLVGLSLALAVIVAVEHPAKASAHHNGIDKNKLSR